MDKTEKLKVSQLAANESINQANARLAEELYTKLFGNKYKNLSSLSIFVPTYHMLVLKQAFYDRGGNPLKAYSIQDYSELLDVPEDFVVNLVETTPDFFIFLHSKRTLTEEIDMLVTIMARRLVNDMQVASVRDASQALSVLSKFSSLVAPEKRKESTFDDLVDELASPEEVLNILDTYGFTKKGTTAKDIKDFGDNFSSPTKDSGDILTIKQLLDNEEK